ncbi:MAG TPA: methylmalonyl-CoA epimerase [Acidobacteriota bacterium]|nr:methylmalonyl-CoA epimerase [Acidobacteriota bacterium]
MIEKIDHLGIAVRNLDDSLRLYKEIFGLELVSIEEVAGQQVRVGMLSVGESKIELLESTTTDGPIARFIESKGEGIHHIALRVDDIRATLAALKAKGVALINEKAVPGAHGTLVAFVHPKATGKVLIELCEHPEG